jgi:polo-like kinase 1
LKKEDPKELKHQKKKLINEIDIHKMMDHENVCKFEHFFEDNKNVYMLLEVCSDKSLHDVLKKRKRLLEIEVKCYTMQIIKAVRHIHLKKVIHRDLKLGNILIIKKDLKGSKHMDEEGLQLKISDFGLATTIDYFGERKTDMCGTPNYMAPELVVNDPEEGHSIEVDIWAIGVIIYTLLVGKPPFEDPGNDIK